MVYQKELKILQQQKTNKMKTQINQLIQKSSLRLGKRIFAVACAATFITASAFAAGEETNWAYPPRPVKTLNLPHDPQLIHQLFFIMNYGA